MKTEWMTPNVIGWLEKILLERFGEHFSLRVIGHSEVRICCKSEAAYISVDAWPTTFVRADSDLPFCSWDATAEGWSSAIPGPIPAPGAERLQSPLIEATETGYHIKFDVLGLTYWMLSRQEEVNRTDLDGHGRFPAQSSHAVKYGYLERPIVDEWISVLRQVAEKTWPSLKLKLSLFETKVSHDVDRPSRYAFSTLAGTIRAMGSEALMRGNVGGALLGLVIRSKSRSKLHRLDPYNTFDWIMDVSERHGLKSAFYFICGRTDASKDGDYEVEHQAIRELMRRIHARGHEIGLHPSYNTFKSAAAVSAEAERLRRTTSCEGITQSEWGGRMHYLRWEHPTTLRALDSAGMSYDTTLSYADRAGFRCGTCFEYPAFDPVLDIALNLRIRPLIVMECTIMDPQYMGLGTSAAALEKFRSFKQTCRAVGGFFTLLWHNSRLGTKAERDLYEAMLEN